jgi:tetratricopeptide (TPR) repeat protein
MSKGKTRPDFRDLPFSQLVQRDERLAEIHRAYASRTAKERRDAADWAYHASSATDIFNRSLARLSQESPFAEGWPTGIEALAIDPTFAPALLTVGSVECQLGRKSETLALFETLLRLPEDTPDLEEILDRAGTCLIEEAHFEAARSFLEGACAMFPKSTLLLGGLSYSLAKLGRHDQTAAILRRAVAVDPDNPELLNDLGWALAENGQYGEAERLLQQAVDLAPPEYDRPQNNLEEVRRRKESGGILDG